MKAIWNGKVIAESSDTIVIENNHYFPKESVKKEYLKISDYSTSCPWKGKASYFDIEFDGNVNKNAAWYYPTPKKEAKEVVGHDFTNYIAFWKGVEVK